MLGILFQILVKIFQNLISLGTVHKCGETHSALIGGNIASFNEVTGLPKVQKFVNISMFFMLGMQNKHYKTLAYLQKSEKVVRLLYF